MIRMISWCALLFVGCAQIVNVQDSQRDLYCQVADSFLMLAREDVENGKSVWGQGSGFVANDDGTNFLYTARHVVIDKDEKLPNKLYATDNDGNSQEIDLSCLEVPKGNHDLARIPFDDWHGKALLLSNHKPRFDERLYFFGDAFGAGVMNVESGKVVGIGPLEFEHTADIVKGMSGGPIVDEAGFVVGVCQKGRKRTAKLNGETLPDDSKYLKVRKFGAVLHGVEWQNYKPQSL